MARMQWPVGTQRTQLKNYTFIKMIILEMQKWTFLTWIPLSVQPRQNRSFFWTSNNPLLFLQMLCSIQIKVRNKVKSKHSLSRSQIYTLHRCPWLAGCLYAYKLVLPLEKPQKILTAEGWTRWYVPLTSCSSNLDSTSCSLGDELVPPGLTFHFPISDVLEQKIYRNVTRKSENSLTRKSENSHS